MACHLESSSGERQADLLSRALERLADPADPARDRYSPLVVVATDPDPNGWLAAVCRAALHDRDDVVAWDGATLGREIARALAEGGSRGELGGDDWRRLARGISAHRLAAIERVDRVAGDEPQRALACLLDAAAARGTAVCVSLGRPPAAAGLAEPLASRLLAGLVVTLAHRPTAADTVDRRPTPARVIRCVARHHGLTVTDLVGVGRRRTVAHARCLAMYLARRLTGRSLEAIGAAFGGRDHTTVLHGVRVATARLAGDPSLADELDRLAAEILRVPTERNRGASGRPSKPRR